MVSVSGEQAMVVEAAALRAGGLRAVPLPAEGGREGYSSLDRVALDDTADRVWAGGFKAALERRRRLTDRLGRPLDPDRFARLSTERDCLAAFLSGEAGVNELLRRARALGHDDHARYSALLERPRALFRAAAERQLALLPTRDDVPRPKERIIRDEVEAACWTTFREGADALVWRVDALGRFALGTSPRGASTEEQVASVLERSCLSTLYGGSRAVAAALRRRKVVAEAGGPARRRAARLAAGVIGPMLEVLLSAEGALPLTH